MANKRITDVDYIDSLNSNESFFVNQNSTLRQINKENVVFGVNNGGTGAKTAKDARLNLGAVTIDNEVITLALDGWTNNNQIVNVRSATANNTVIVAPDSDTNNYEAYIDFGVRCIKQEEGKLTFYCEKTPDIAIIVNVAMFS